MVAVSGVFPEPAVGLCSVCAHSQRLASKRGSVFWLCGRANQDARFRKYPPLPMLACPGFEAAGPDGGSE